MLRDGKAAVKIKNKIWHLSKVRKVHIFGVGFEEKHLFGNASIVVIEKPRFYI